MDPDDSRWVDADAGPVARPYMLTGGRTKPRGRLRFDLIDFVVRTGKPAEGYPYTPERSRLLLELLDGDGRRGRGGLAHRRRVGRWLALLLLLQLWLSLLQWHRGT